MSKKRIISLILSLFMVLSLLPGYSLTVIAEEGETDEAVPAQEEDEILPAEEEEDVPLFDGGEFSIGLEFQDDNDVLYSDGMKVAWLTYTVPEELDPSEYNIVFSAGVPGEDGWEIEFVPGEDYTYDDSDGTITINGGKIWEKAGALSEWVRLDSSVVLTNGDIPASDQRTLWIRKAVEDYEKEGDVTMLPGWETRVQSHYRVHVENTDYPDGGRDEMYQVDLVSSSNTDVASVTKDEQDGSFIIRALAMGDAHITVQYTDIHNAVQTYGFHVYVGSDVYKMFIFTESGSEWALPGDEVPLFANASHETYDPQTNEYNNLPTDSFTFSWEVDDWASDYLILETDGEHTDQATVRFKDPEDLPEGDQENLFKEIYIHGFAYDGIDEETGDPILVAEAHQRFFLADNYTTLWPAGINPAIPVGGRFPVTAQVREYDAQYGGEGWQEPDGIIVEYYWEYGDSIEIEDEEGNVVGNSQEPSGIGGSCDFTIHRLRPQGGDIRLLAVVLDEDTEEILNKYEQRYYLFDMFNNMWFEWNHNRRLFSDGDLAYTLRMEGFDGLTEGDDYDLILKVGQRNEEGWDILFSEGTEYDYDSDTRTITLYGDKVLESGAQWINLYAEADADGAAICEPCQADCEFREARTEFDRIADDNMLPGWEWQVDREYRVRIENTEHPDGFEENYRVTDVEIISQTPDQEGEDVLVLTGPENENDPWRYRAEGYGTATVQVSYEYPEGEEQSYTFTICVTADVYRVDLWTQDGSDISLPGVTKALQAFATHESHEEVSTDGISYVWSVTDGEEFVESIQADAGDGSKAFLTFGTPDEENYRHEVMVEVKVYDSMAENPSVPVARNDMRLFLSDRYYEIWPAQINPDLDMGQSITVNPELRLYEAGGEEDYTVINEDIYYRWYYDSNAVTVIDEEDLTVGNDTEGNYNGSEASAGAGRAFTITRLTGWRTHIELRMDYVERGDNWEEPREAGRGYDLNDRDYNIWFDDDHIRLYNDTSETVRPNTDALGDLEYTLEYEVGIRDGDRWLHLFEEDDAYSVDEDGWLTVFGAKVEPALREYGRNDLNIRALIMYNGEEVRDAWCNMDLWEACGNHRFMELVIEKATDEKAGLKGYICWHCYEKYYEEIPKADPMTVEAVEAAIAPGKTTNLTVTGAIGALSYESSDPAVAEVSGNGLVTAKKEGTAVITVTAEGDKYYEALTGTAEITVAGAKSIADAAVTGIVNKTFTGSAITQSPKVVLDGITLKSGTDYTLSYKNNKNPGKATVTITGKGSYIGSQSKTFYVLFTDVPEKHSYQKAVYWAVDEGIGAGYTGSKLGLFGVNDDITRGQVMMFLWRAAGKPEPKSSSQTFTDVPVKNNFFKAIQWGVEQGITGGYSGAKAGQFGPNDNCTRGQIVTFLWRFANKPEPSKHTQTFTDVPVKHSFYKAIQWASENGITSGYKDGSFGVNKNCTRGQCVTFLYRLLN